MYLMVRPWCHHWFKSHRAHMMTHCPLVTPQYVVGWIIESWRTWEPTCVRKVVCVLTKASHAAGEPRPIGWYWFTDWPVMAEVDAHVWTCTSYTYETERGWVIKHHITKLKMLRVTRARQKVELLYPRVDGASSGDGKMKWSVYPNGVGLTCRD